MVGASNFAAWTPVLSAFVAAFVSGLIAWGTSRRELAKLQAEFKLEHSTESALEELLRLDELPYRSFQMIRHHIGGFESNELRRILVRAGAVRFMAADGTELWALRDRVAEDFRRGRWKHSESPRNKANVDALFPAALKNPSEY